MSSYEKFIQDLGVFAKKYYGTPSKMADQIDYSQSTLSKILGKRSRPRIDTICELLDKLGAHIVFPGLEVYSPAKEEKESQSEEESSKIEDLLKRNAELEKELIEERRLSRELMKDNRQLMWDLRAAEQNIPLPSSRQEEKDKQAVKEGKACFLTTTVSKNGVESDIVELEDCNTPTQTLQDKKAPKYKHS